MSDRLLVLTENLVVNLDRMTRAEFLDGTLWIYFDSWHEGLGDTNAIALEGLQAERLWEFLTLHTIHVLDLEP